MGVVRVQHSHEVLLGRRNNANPPREEANATPCISLEEIRLRSSPMSETNDNTPVMCVHGWGGSFATTWERNGFTALLADAGRPVIGVDLLGHGEAPKPHEPEAYADLTTRVVDALPDDGTAIDAVGFSMGALTFFEPQQNIRARSDGSFLPESGKRVRTRQRPNRKDHCSSRWQR